MGQLFKRRSNSLVQLSLIALIAVMGASAVFWIVVRGSPWETEVGVPMDQPVPFSHKHHVSGLGLDCRYCHTSVETSAFAGMPPTETCITCHSQIWSDSPMLEPVRASWREYQSSHWTRVH